LSKIADTRKKRRRKARIKDVEKGASKAATNARDLTDQARETGKDVADRVRPYASEAWDAAQPGIEAARDRLNPVVDQARARIAPAAESARETIVTDVLPRAADSVAQAADYVADRAHGASTRAHDLSSQALELAEAQRKSVKKARRRKRVKAVAVLTIFATAGAAIASVLRRRAEEEQWKSYDPSAGPWAPAPSAKTDDEAGAGPDEAAADTDEGPHQPSSRDEPLIDTSVDDQQVGGKRARREGET